MLETGGERQQSEQQTTLNEAVVGLMGGLEKEKKRKMKGRKRKRGRQMFECIFLFHHTFQHQVFFLSTLVFISTSIQTRTQIPSPLEFFQ